MSPKQELALRAFRRYGTLDAVALAVGCKKPAACRLLQRARRRARVFIAAAAVGGDPLDALDAVRGILAV
jgi:hypothetical protein